MIAPEVFEKFVYSGELLLAAFELIHAVPEARGSGEPLGVPGNVLACDLDSPLLAVERIKLVQMRDQYGVNFRNQWRRKFFAGGQIMSNLAEDPGPPLSGATDHDPVGTRVLQHVLRFLGSGDVAVCNHGQARRFLELADRVVLGLARKSAGARAAVQRQQLYAAFLGDSRDFEGVFAGQVPAGAELEGDRHRSE